MLLVHLVPILISNLDNPEPQLLPCTPACGYKFHALVVNLHNTFTVPPVVSAFRIQSNICGGPFSWS